MTDVKPPTLDDPEEGPTVLSIRHSERLKEFMRVYPRHLREEGTSAQQIRFAWGAIEDVAAQVSELRHRYNEDRMAIEAFQYLLVGDAAHGKPGPNAGILGQMQRDLQQQIEQKSEAVSREIRNLSSREALEKATKAAREAERVTIGRVVAATIGALAAIATVVGIILAIAHGTPHV